MHGDAGHRGQRVLSRLSGREREHAVAEALREGVRGAGNDRDLTLNPTVSNDGQTIKKPGSSVWNRASNC